MEVPQHQKDMDNERLKAEADNLMVRCGFGDILAGYSAWFVGGSYNYDLMCWRDLDVYVLDQEHDLRGCFETGYKLTEALAAKKSFFTNNIDDVPNGLYWGIRTGDVRVDAWKIDLWFLGLADYDRHAQYCEKMRENLTLNQRNVILLIKRAYWRRPEYRDTVTSDTIYRAVMDYKVKTLAGFEKLLISNHLHDR